MPHATQRPVTSRRKNGRPKPPPREIPPPTAQDVTDVRRAAGLGAEHQELIKDALIQFHADYNSAMSRLYPSDKKRIDKLTKLRAHASALADLWHRQAFIRYDIYSELIASSPSTDAAECEALAAKLDECMDWVDRLRGLAASAMRGIDIEF